MPPNINHFQIRSATSAGNDAQSIIAAWDSTLPYLASIGAGEMWGSELFSQRGGFQQDIEKIIQKSEEDDQNDNRRLLVAEIETPDDGIVQLGAAMIRDALPKYLVESQELKSVIEKAGSLLFIEVLISDHLQRRYRGAGAALVEAIKHRAREAGKATVYVDAWAGNKRKLNRYYEDLGFKNVGEFSLTRRNGSTWPGTLYCIDLTQTGQ